MARVAVIGAGAIGGTLAAWLAETHEVIVCTRSPLADIEVTTKGRILRATPTILLEPSRVGSTVDWVLSTTKTYDSASAAAWLPALVGPETRLAVIQNGVEHAARFPSVVADRTLPVIIDLPAERSAPGRILQRRDGSMHVPDGDAGRAFAALFAATPIAVETTNDFTTVAWRKLAVNCTGAVNALVLRPAEVTHDDAVADVMRALVRECVAVGRAEGATLPDSLADEVVARMRAADAGSVSSIHADRIHGRPMEIDARNGVIVRLGAKHGIDAPMNRALAALLAAASEAPRRR